VEDAHTRALVASWVLAWDQVAAEVDAAALALALAADGDTISPSMIGRSARMQAALEAVSGSLDQLALEAADGATGRLRVAVDEAIAAEQAMITAQLPPRAAGGVLSTTLHAASSVQVTAMVQRVSGQITSRHREISPAATAAIRRELARGIAVGDNPRTAARRMVRGIEDQFNGGLTRAMTIARTEMLDAAREASHVVDQANRSTLAGWVWEAHLDPSTCRSCIAMHGTLHPVDEPGPYDHPNGRCARVPKTKTWAELGFEGIDEPRDLQSDADAWFEGLSEEQQRRILGGRGYEQWRSGNWPREQWSQRRTADGWRDSHVPARAPGRGSGGGSGGRPPTGPLRGAPAGDDGPLGERILMPGAERAGVVYRPDGLLVAQHELDTANRLAAVGLDITFNPLDFTRGARNPDVTIGGFAWEIKSPQGAGRHTISRQLARGRHQADRLILDTARTPLADPDILDELRRRLIGQRSFLEAIHVAKDGTVTWLTHRGTV
jgi:SPP1 gp7 family putative phage head morphogenesis protein